MIDVRRDGPLSGRRVERIVLQPLAEIGDLQPSTLLKLCQINEQLVGNSSVLVGESDIVIWLQSLGDIVGVQ